MVAVRGGGYQAEWAGNFNVGPGSGKHDGFSRAEIQVRNGLEEYLNDNADKLEDRMKVWICGYSRAAATSNLLAADLDNGAINGINKKNVYAFCFECPYSTGEAGTRSEDCFCVMTVDTNRKRVNLLRVGAHWTQALIDRISINFNY